MKLKGLLDQLNQLAKERPEALEMEVGIYDSSVGNSLDIKKIEIEKDYLDSEFVEIKAY